MEEKGKKPESRKEFCKRTGIKYDPYYKWWQFWVGVAMAVGGIVYLVFFSSPTFEIIAGMASIVGVLLTIGITVFDKSNKSIVSEVVSEMTTHMDKRFEQMITHMDKQLEAIHSTLKELPEQTAKALRK